MIDVKVLVGSSIMDESGHKGRILSVSLPWVKIAWTDQLPAQEESLLRSDPRLRESVFIMTLDRGWVPLGTVIGVAEEQEAPQTEHAPLISELQSILDEAKKKKNKGTEHNPFKNKSHLGPGPYGGENDETGKWKCSCSAYKCVCTSGERRKIVKIDRAYKKKYNKIYKKWRKGQS